MCKVIVFAGTTEGREIAEFLERRQIPGHICVATEYGEQLLPESPVLEISHQRLDLEEMKVLFQEKDPEMVVDATHPYAAQVTENIKKACEETGKEYIRILRENQEMKEEGDWIFADSVEKACNLMMEYKAPDTVCGIVGNIGREGESMKVLTLEELKTTKVDMFTTVFVGNSQTKNIGGKMVTPRGYKNV